MSETLRVKCPVTEDNDQGYYVIEASDLIDGMELFGEGEVKSPEDMTVAELEATLAEAGMDAPKHAKKADLIALCLSLPE